MPLDIAQIQQARPQNEIRYFKRIGSTMTEAARLASGGAPDKTVVVAEEQTAGIGRLGRTWHSAAELGIYLTVVLRLPLTAANMPVAGLALGLATAEAIQKRTKLACDLRWPNDVLIGGRKVAGILAQLVENCVLAGIGINVNHTSLPSDLRTPATSLRIESHGNVQSREKIAVALLEQIDVFASMLVSQGPDTICRAFSAASSYTQNRRVVVEEGGKTGVTAGLDQHGFLLLRLENGQIERVASGGIRPLA